MTERITPEQIARIRADYRAVATNTTDGGSGEDFATLAAWLPALLDEIERLERIIADGAYPIEQLRQQVVYLYPDMTGVDRAGERLRSRMAAVQRWHQEALAPPPAREEGATTDDNGD